MGKKSKILRVFLSTEDGFWLEEASVMDEIEKKRLKSKKELFVATNEDFQI